MVKTKCYFIYKDHLEGTSEDELHRTIEGYGLMGYPIYINGYKKSICIYTAVVESCAVLIGCRVFDGIEYTVDDVKMINRLGLVGKKIYDMCTTEI